MAAFNEVVRAAIHPSIGIARVGNSADEFFVGPEVDEPPALDAYKDAAGALKRQAARFRVFGYDAAGTAVAELTADNADITWTVHVANKKAAWYQFQLALDIPEALDPRLAPSLPRNNAITGNARAQLAIDPGPRSITGRDEAGAEYRFDTGRFFHKAVYLGELRTDEAGRLLVLGGRGDSAAHTGEPLSDFANNDGWHDDVSDGPVTAEVTIDGRKVPVDPSWVVVAPPNYAPPIVTVRTLYDLLYDSFVQAGALAFPERTSFKRDVYPILTRLTGLQWVNEGFAARFGWGGRDYFLDHDYLERLASPAAEHAELRRQIWATFRDWDRDGESPVPWPWFYGDAMALPPTSPRQHLGLSATQMALLERWALGDFDSDLVSARTLEEVAVADQPATLDRASLIHCLADAFHPGCEVTWPIRHVSMFMAPFRIRHRASTDPETWPGTQLTPAAALAPGGPLYGQSPGSLTRWMAVPWQADTSSCRSGYFLGFGEQYDPYLPTFWPARVPNHVLTEEDYAIVVDENRTPDERQTAFAARAHWLRWLAPKKPQYLYDMVANFGKLGVVQRQPGPKDGHFPADLLVESEVGFDEPVDPRRGLRPLHVPAARDPDAAEDAIASALDDIADPDEHITAGYLSKVARFRREP